ncbi:MAG TPA: hypothetical protein VK801_03510 [Caulobacteraceae bacterium]|jgi:uncharacterized membrane protein|nr:hypothetical protein [Caulobacteraceae bacterium]
MRIASAGHAVFAAVLIAIGLLGFVRPDYAGVWQAVPRRWPAHEAIALVCAVISLGSGLGLLWRRTAVPAAGVLALWLVLWMLTVKLAGVMAARWAVAAWDGAGETAVLIAAAWVLFAGERRVRLARGLYALTMIVFGVAHLAYVTFTGSLVPAWLPAHAAWVYLTGFTYIAAGAAMLAGVAARAAAALSALQMGLFTLLVWVPIVASGRAGAPDWSETTVSIALTAAGWVIADTYRGAPWFGVARRPLAA